MWYLSLGSFPCPSLPPDASGCGCFVHSVSLTASTSTANFSVTFLSVIGDVNSTAEPRHRSCFFFPCNVVFDFVALLFRHPFCRFRFMRAYPAEGQAELIFDAVVKAIGNGLDPDQMRADTAALKTWAEGKSEDDVVAAMKSDDKRYAAAAWSTVCTQKRLTPLRVQ